jgi:MFS family permease
MTDPRTGTTAPVQPKTARVEISIRYRNYALALLLLVYVVNFVDRQILTILLEAIKHDLGLSDTQLGFLTGIAFALFYAIAGIPIARWADRGTRRSIVALGLALWSGMTALCGLAQNFTHLMLARIGVGLGEAACQPSSHSLISDYFPPERRGVALSVYSLGIPIGIMGGYLIGGWINHYFDWRTAFLVVGIPGIFLALLVRLTLQEPPRGYAEGAQAAADAETLGSTLRFIWSLRSYRHMALAAALHTLYGYGALAFVPVFMIRSHGMTNTAELGAWLGIIALIVGVTGILLGGALSDHFGGRRDARWYMWVPAGATLLSLPFTFLFYLWPDPRIALLINMPAQILNQTYIGPTLAMTQGLVRLRMRALASAILLFLINLIGLGLGPQVVGILSDWLTPVHGANGIRYALLSVVIAGSLWSSFHYFLAARTLRRDLEAKNAR